MLSNWSGEQRKQHGGDSAADMINLIFINFNFVGQFSIKLVEREQLGGGSSELIFGTLFPDTFLSNSRESSERSSTEAVTVQQICLLI